MWRKVIRGIGYTIMGLAFIGLCLELLLAVRSGQPVYGTNYRGIPLFTYSTIVTLGVVAVVLAALAVRRIYDALKRRPPK